jgi:hypothetical protein
MAFDRHTPSQETANENFYEFFFSHLPLIEHQIKEFKEKLFESLPIYFQQQATPHPHNRSSFSAASPQPPTVTNATRIG